MNTTETTAKNANGGTRPVRNGNVPDMDTLIKGLQNEDTRNQKMTRNFKWFLTVMVVVYTLLMVVNPDRELEWHHRLTGFCYVAAFALFALLFRKYNKEYSQVDYSVSSCELFKAAAERYKFKMSRLLSVLPSILLIDAGLTISFLFRRESFNRVEDIFWIQLVYFSVMGLAFFAGYLIWRIREKPLRDGALKILKDLNEDQ
ncbi:MAG: hypothetical protein ACOYXB_12980 [Bacteroidota bacterium]